MLFAAIASKSIIDSDDVNDSDNYADFGGLGCRQLQGNKDDQFDAR